MQVGCRLAPRLWNLRLDGHGFCGASNLHLTPPKSSTACSSGSGRYCSSEAGGETWADAPRYRDSTPLLRDLNHAAKKSKSM
jgi:hypothetical protein